MQRVVETPAPLSEDRLAEAIASKVVAIVRDELGLSRDDEWIDAREVARRFGLSRSWVYEHSGHGTTQDRKRPDDSPDGRD